MPLRTPGAPTIDPRIRALPAAEIRRRFVAFFAARGHEVVPSASLVPAGDPTLLFTNAGMVQFKDVLTGAETRSYRRAVDYQRCLRVAGKHNDFEEVGRTPRHHTLFEMLGNWSFGDYFKREAIHFAWEFLTEELGIPGERLAATTYRDDELARSVWREEIGLPPERMAAWGDVDAGDDHNFWRMADTGPCGPCSEIHFDRGQQFSEGPGCLPDHAETCPRWLEIWNLVFMEFDQRPEGRVPLPFASVDTGLGLERLASVLQQVPSNYDTDLFTPLHERLREMLGHDPETFEHERFSYQVIADHARAVTFLVADEVRPANEGRGYVLRRILRRAVRHGRLLGRREPFLAALAGVVVETMAGAYPYLLERAAEIRAVVSREEAQFARTLDAGTAMLETTLEPLAVGEPVVGRLPESLPPDAPVLPGAVAFRLHDTYGFPIDLTVDMAAEHGVRVDRPGFEVALAEQRERSRSGRKAELAHHAETAAAYEAILRRVGGPTFLGYQTTSAEGRVVALLRAGREVERVEPEASSGAGELAGAGEVVEVVLDRTPFYAESGGQVGDQGVLRATTEGVVLVEVEDTQRPVGAQVGGLIVHHGRALAPLAVGDLVEAVVDDERRARTMRNHTATHLLHRALRNVVGDRARQHGSLVGPDGLRFDFPLERPLTVDELRAIEAEVRRVIRADEPVSPEEMSLAEATAAGADAFFDEKYGERVRVVVMDAYSRELCGGTHCRATGQVGSFVLTGERSIGSGLRRIEALTGEAADAWLAARIEALDQVAEALGARAPDEAPARAAALQARLQEAERRLRRGAAAARPKPADLAATAVAAAPGVALVAQAVELASMEDLKALAREVRTALPSGVIALALVADEPQLFVTVSDDLVGRGVSAGALVRAALPAIAGRGGGRPEMAQAKGSRPAGLQAALAALRGALDGRA